MLEELSKIILHFHKQEFNMQIKVTVWRAEDSCCQNHIKTIARHPAATGIFSAYQLQEEFFPEKKSFYVFSCGL